MNHALKTEQKLFINARPDEVWDGLVNPEKIKVYLYGTNTKSDWKTGSEIIFEGEYEGMQYRDRGIIKSFEPQKRLEYTYWSSFSKLDDLPGNYSTICFTLSPFADGTELCLSQHGFPDLQAQQHAESSWDMVLQGLKEVVE